MRYRVSIAPGENASEVASVVAFNHGNWFDSVDGVGDNEGIVFIDAHEGEDKELIREMAEHESVVDYDTVAISDELAAFFARSPMDVRKSLEQTYIAARKALKVARKAAEKARDKRVRALQAELKAEVTWAAAWTTFKEVRDTLNYRRQGG